MRRSGRIPLFHRSPKVLHTQSRPATRARYAATKRSSPWPRRRLPRPSPMSPHLRPPPLLPHSERSACRACCGAAGSRDGQNKEELPKFPRASAAELPQIPISRTPAQIGRHLLLMRTSSLRFESRPEAVTVDHLARMVGDELSQRSLTQQSQGGHDHARAEPQGIGARHCAPFGPRKRERRLLTVVSASTPAHESAGGASPPRTSTGCLRRPALAATTRRGRSGGAPEPVLWKCARNQPVP